MSLVKDEFPKHFQNILFAFLNYESYCFQWLHRMVKAYEELPPTHQNLIGNFCDKQDELRKRIQSNKMFLSHVCETTELFQNIDMHDYYQIPTESDKLFHSHGLTQKQQLEADMEKVKSTIRQFVREWSLEGEDERNHCYLPILNELEQRFKDQSSRHNIKVLCPGSGLGRLPFEIAKLGFYSQGNEFSYFMLITSNFILNRSTQIEQYVIYPYIHQTSNVVFDSDQLRGVSIPDIVPSSVLSVSNAEFSMCAGDFVEVYKQQKGSWDCVVTCFFIDTAKNIIEYIETIYSILKPGGLWINFGPLQYHFAEIQEYSLELSLQQLESISKSMGFNFENFKINQPCSYVANKKSMITVMYNNAFWVASKGIK